jgi:hypothetical protein
MFVTGRCTNRGLTLGGEEHEQIGDWFFYTGHIRHGADDSSDGDASRGRRGQREANEEEQEEDLQQIIYYL